jgi:hypothetical protein
MKKTIVEISDDLGGAGEATTVTFAFQGKSYEIDLNKRNKETFERHMQRWIEGGREVAAPARSNPFTARTVAPAEVANQVLLARVRVWAAKEGIEIKGEVPNDLIEKYQAAQS